MNKVPWGRLAPLAIVAVLLIAGSLRIQNNPAENDGPGLVAAGFILLGVWIAVDLHDRWHDHGKKEDDDERE